MECFVLHCSALDISQQKRSVFRAEKCQVWVAMVVVIQKENLAVKKPWYFYAPPSFYVKRRPAAILINFHYFFLLCLMAGEHFFEWRQKWLVKAQRDLMPFVRNSAAALKTHKKDKLKFLDLIKQLGFFVLCSWNTGRAFSSVFTQVEKRNKIGFLSPTILSLWW